MNWRNGLKRFSIWVAMGIIFTMIVVALSYILTIWLNFSFPVVI
jgi:hypothetical protein